MDAHDVLGQQEAIGRFNRQSGQWDVTTHNDPCSSWNWWKSRLDPFASVEDPGEGRMLRDVLRMQHGPSN